MAPVAGLPFKVSSHRIRARDRQSTRGHCRACRKAESPLGVNEPGSAAPMRGVRITEPSQAKAASLASIVSPQEYRLFDRARQAYSHSVSLRIPGHRQKRRRLAVGPDWTARLSAVRTGAGGGAPKRRPSRPRVGDLASCVAAGAPIAALKGPQPKLRCLSGCGQRVPFRLLRGQQHPWPTPRRHSRASSSTRDPELFN